MSSPAQRPPGTADARHVDGYALVTAILDRYLPAGDTWDSATLDGQQRSETEHIRRRRNKVRQRVELTASGRVVSGAATVLAARRMGLVEIPARWLTTHEPAGANPDPYWVLFEHRLGRVGDRAVCRCAATFATAKKTSRVAQHSRHLAEVLWSADTLAPVLDARQQAADILLQHQPQTKFTHTLMVDQCRCGARFNSDTEPGAWIQHRVDQLTAAGLIIGPQLRHLLR